MSNLPKQFKRLANGLVEGLEYQYLPDGRIDWKSHLSSKWLRVKDDKKSEVEMRYGAKIKDLDLSKVEDYYLYVTLGGYNDVARLRGFNKLNHSVDFVDGTKAVVTCTMSFIPNVEEPDGLTCAGVASGSLYNINPDFAVFMETIAENRAFTRCVRRALNINIVSQEELGPEKGKGISLPIPDGKSITSSLVTESAEKSGFKPHVVLANRCKELKISFEKLKTRAVTIKDLLKSDPEKWNDFEDIEKNDIWTLIGKINESVLKS